MPNSTESDERAGRKSRALPYLSLLLLAFAVRFFSGAPFFLSPEDEGTRNFEIYDSCYHMRRAWMAIENYPSVSFYDSYHYFPDNPTVPWPAGYTLFLATVAKPFDLVCDSTLVTETVVGIIPCIVDAITVVLFLLFFSWYLPFLYAWLGALMIALSYLNIAFSEAGYIDHHYFMNFMVACCACFMGACDRKKSVAGGIVFGTILGLTLFFNVSFIQFVLAFLFSSFCGLLADRDARERIKPTASIFISAICAAFIVALTTPAGRRLEVRYDEISLFQILLMVFLMLFGGTVLLLFKPKLVSRRPRIAITVLLAAGAALLALVTYHDVMEGARFLLMGNRLNSNQSEEAPIAKYLPMWQNYFTWCVVFLPLGIINLLKNYRKKTIFFVCSSLLFLYGCVTGLSHLLYILFLFPWYALMIALGMQLLMDLVKPRLKLFRYVLLLPFLIQSGHSLWTEKIQKVAFVVNEHMYNKQTIHAFAWLREHSPATSHFKFGDGPPEYSVMAHRDFGHQLVRTAHRPVVTSPFSTPDFLDHMLDYVRFTLSFDEEQAVAFMERYGSRYLVLDDRDIRTLDFLVGILEGEPDHEDYKSKITPATLGFLFRNNLLMFDGTMNWQKAPSAKRFRLIYEGGSKLPINVTTSSKNETQTFPNFKIFQFVKGAKVTGRGYRPREQVVFQIPLVTNTGRRFVYSLCTRADEKGRVATVLPYASEKSPASAVVPAAPHYMVLTASTRKPLSVPEESVMNGNSLVIK